MTLAWLLFAFVGLFTARYMRQVWEPTKLLGEKAWFTVSNYIQNIITLRVNSDFNILTLDISSCSCFHSGQKEKF